jgi:hypothetical protein
MKTMLFDEHYILCVFIIICFKNYVINNSISVFRIFESLCKLYILRSYDYAQGTPASSRAPCHFTKPP